jgi:hypothetical protein
MRCRPRQRQLRNSDPAETMNTPRKTGLRALNGGGFRALAVADLFRGKSESANAAAPARRRACREPGHSRVTGKPGTHQFAITSRTMSLNHKPSYSKEIFLSQSLEELIGNVDGSSLLSRETRGITIAIPSQTRHVVALVLCFCQCLAFQGSEFCVITGFLPILARS